MTLSTVLGLIFIPVTFAVVEYLSHRFVRGGSGDHHGLRCAAPATNVRRAKFGRREPVAAEGGQHESFLPIQSAGLVCLIALISISLAACKVGPKYVRPQLTAPPAFRGADDAQVSS